MPWMETNVVKERLAFVHDLESGHWSMTELCERYGVTRPTGYKWLARHQAGGGADLVDRSRAPQTCPHRRICGADQGRVALGLERIEAGGLWNESGRMSQKMPNRDSVPCR